VHIWVDKATRVPVKKAFYAVSEKVLKYYTITSSTMKDGRLAEAEMEYVDALKPEDKSKVRLFDITPLSNVPDQFFTKEYLESGRLFPYDF
jgi:hypothetical protein